ncbi:peptidylprolyl isomerase [Candidatus Woesearchaeota archaeon]|nr:peptidylprolyl isomerase [Candidatus Woesearchaeota archaeon]
MNDQKAKNGNKVTVHYTGMFEDGRQFDSSQGKEPLTFTIGKVEVVQGFENAVTGMLEGEEKTVTIKPEQAYGIHDPNLRRQVPKNVLPAGQKLEKGMVLGIKMSAGQTFPATVTEYTNDNVTIDLNHPLAGKTLTFRIKLLKIE